MTTEDHAQPMSIEDEGRVDFIGINVATGDVVLTVSDHLDWSDQLGHLFLLQEKVNRYLAFVESGELLEAYPDAVNRRVRIAVVGRHELPPEAQDFVERLASVVRSAGLDLEYRQLIPGAT